MNKNKKLDWRNIKFHEWFLFIGANRNNPFEISKNTTMKNLIHELKKIYI